MANSKSSPERIVREIKRKRRSGLFSKGFRERIHPSQYTKWSKEFLESGTKRLAGEENPQANRGEQEYFLRVVQEVSGRQFGRSERPYPLSQAVLEQDPRERTSEHRRAGPRAS